MLSVSPVNLMKQQSFKSVMPDDQGYGAAVALPRAYEANDDKYEALAISAYRQIIDNNNELLDAIGTRKLTENDLYVPFGEYLEDADNSRISLQPLAYCQVKAPAVTQTQTATPTPTATPTAIPTTATAALPLLPTALWNWMTATASCRSDKL